MPLLAVNGINLAYEEWGEGTPLVFAHEFAGSIEAWKPQARRLARYYRVIAYNARGYPPSDVPSDPDAYSLDQIVDDLRGLLTGLGIESAHVGGLSMGGGLSVAFALTHPNMCRSIIVASAGSGSDNPEEFRAQQRATAEIFEREGLRERQNYEWSPTRIQLLNKDPISAKLFLDQYFNHSALGRALTMRGIQAKRPPLYDYEAKLKQLDVPALIMIGDEDEPCVQPALFLKRTIPRSGLAVFPKSGHAINLEEPELFNRQVLEFLTAVDSGKWGRRGE
jgi:pimeloyl-ACP methyl ester carboxylesterase